MMTLISESVVNDYLRYYAEETATYEEAHSPDCSFPILFPQSRQSKKAMTAIINDALTEEARRHSRSETSSH